MIRTAERVAAKVHRCSTCDHRILFGERYVVGVLSPDHGDTGYPHWQTLKACSSCASRYVATYGERQP